jgi:ABC-type transporter Mla subunit MlaD
MLANADSLLGESAGNITGMLANLNRLTDELQSVSSRLDQMMDNNTQVVQNTLAQLNSTMARADTLLISLSRTTQSVNGMVGQNQASLYEAMQNLQDASQHFEQFSRSIKERPWNLVRKSNPPERKLP